MEFFLRELCGAEYVHEPLLAPTQELLDGYKKRKGVWSEYERDFLDLMRDREIETKLPHELFRGPSVLLCSEATAHNCHRRLVGEYLREKWPEERVTLRHL